MRLIVPILLMAVCGFGPVAAQVGEGVTIRLTPPGSHVDSIRVAYAGVLEIGHELNRLTPCGAWTPDSLGGAPFARDGIGLGSPVEGATVGGRSEPDSSFFPGPIPENALPALFVRGTGWLVGPGAYGHFGVTRYEIRTEDYEELRWAQVGECGVVRRE